MSELKRKLTRPKNEKSDERNRKTIYCVLDYETDPFLYERTPEPFAAGFYDGEQYVSFWGKGVARRLWKYLVNFGKKHRDKNVVIYAHNGGKFDFHFFKRFLHPSRHKLFLIKSRIAKWVTPYFELRDSWLILPVKLSSLEKGKIDYAKFEKEVRDLYRDEIEKYLRLDCVYLLDYIQHFIRLYGEGLTLAGRAFSELRKRKIKPVRTWEDYDSQFRPFYYGGRCECFVLGSVRSKFVYLDINSAYPAAMCEEHWGGTEYDTIVGELPTDETLKYSFIRVEGKNRGALPFRCPRTGRLIFDQSEGTFDVTGWELEAAMRLRRFDLHKVLVSYVPRERVGFGKFVDDFYRIRKETGRDTPQNKLAKLMMNAPYGRYAINPREFRDIKITKFKEEPDENRHARILGRKPIWTYAGDFSERWSIWERPISLVSATFYNVCTAASITGKVRATMLEALCGVKRAFYCDTDSILCESAGDLCIGADLGQWKVEAECSEGHFAGKKLYAIRTTKGEWKTASKGVNLNPDEIIRVSQGESLTYKFDAPNYSLFRSPAFTKREIKRMDKMRDFRGNVTIL